jgi:deoxycytidylate deaminase
LEPPLPAVDDKPFTLDYAESELVFGLVYAVGTDYLPVQNFLEDQISLCGYSRNRLHISEWFREIIDRLGLTHSLPTEPEYDRVEARINAGNMLRAKSQLPDLFASYAASKIYSTRNGLDGEEPGAHKKTAHLLISLKRPEEVETLRKIYGPGFFLIGIFAGEAERIDFLVKRKGLERPQAEELIQRDEREDDDSGQRTRDTFQMADVFVAVKNGQYEQGLGRFLRLVFGEPLTTPTRDEHAMFLAYAASLRSGSLARQVGAALTCSHGDVIAVGCNDVPAPGGGLYWDDDEADFRDHTRGEDSNDQQKARILDDIARQFRQHFLPERDEEAFLAEARSVLRGTLLSDITEFGRSMHAEMEALSAAGRTGVSFRDATLYTTTFPCHTCTRHIVAAGIKRVVYIEPYPKSLASELHSDAIRLLADETPPPGVPGRKDDRIPFEPFLGIGPRRFFDLFSLKLSSGYTIERKADDGRVVKWDQRHARPRVPMPPTSYIEREQLVSTRLNRIFARVKENESATASPTPRDERIGVLVPPREDGAPGRKVARLEDRRSIDIAASGRK